MTTKEQIDEYLKDLPSKWKKELSTILCQIAANKQIPDCQTVKDCETLTSLTDFSTDGSIASITYKDETETEVTRTFDLTELVNHSLDGVDPSCLTDQTTWDSLSYKDRIQLLITEHCECCS